MAVSPTPSTTTRQSLESFNWNLSLRCVFDTICGMSGFVFVTFALGLGIPKESLGLLASIASFAALFQMLSLMALARIGDKKRYTIRLAIFEPLILIACVLLLPSLPQPLRFPVLGIAVFTAAAALNLTRPITDDWLASSIPDSIRGRYLGKRMQISSLILILAMAGTGFLARGLPKDNPMPYSLFMTAGALFAILAAFALSRAHLSEPARPDPFSWSVFPGLMKNRLFLGCLLVSLVYNIPFWFAMPYYQVVYLKVFHMSEIDIALMLVLYYIVKIACSPILGRWITRCGARSVIFWVTVPYLYLFFSFTICTPERTWPLWIGWIGAALADTGFSLAITAALYEAVPRDGPRRPYFVTNNLMTFAVAGILTACSAGLTDLLKDQAWTLGSWHLGQFQILYLLCTLALIPLGFGSAFFLPAKPERSSPV
jgi:MFS family permease